MEDDVKRYGKTEHDVQQLRHLTARMRRALIKIAKNKRILKKSERNCTLYQN